MTRLKDISDATGVSITQVSRALGGYKDVNAKTRQKVIDAARQLGYRPNAMARGLKTGRTGIVALVLPANIDASTQEILFDMILGISSEFARRNIKLILHVDSDGGPAVYRELLNWGVVDGFVLLDPRVNDKRIQLLLECGIPIAVHGRDPAQTHPYVDVDNAKIGQELGQAIVNAGHRRACFINGPADRAFAKARAVGAQNVFAKAGRVLSVDYGPMTRERGHELALGLLRGPDAPTAFITGNTMLARGVYDAAEELKLRIPQELLVVAHDDVLPLYPPDAFKPPLPCTRSALSKAWPEMAVILEQLIEKGPDSVQGTILDAPFQSPASSV